MGLSSSCDSIQIHMLQAYYDTISLLEYPATSPTTGVELHPTLLLSLFRNVVGLITLNDIETSPFRIQLTRFDLLSSTYLPAK
jgi:hypothetical protein